MLLLVYRVLCSNTAGASVVASRIAQPHVGFKDSPPSAGLGPGEFRHIVYLRMEISDSLSLHPSTAAQPDHANEPEANQRNRSRLGDHTDIIDRPDITTARIEVEPS